MYIAHEEAEAKRKKRNLKSKQKEKEGDDVIEVKAEKTYSDYDSDDIAEIRAIGKHIMRKKNRIELLESCYNKNTYDYDPSTLPAWFLEEEAKYNQPIIPVSKEEVEAEKKFIKDYNARPSQKVAEFKLRKKKRMLKAMKRVREKANQIANSGDLNASSKMRQIKQLYNKEKRKLDQQNRKKKDVVVSRSFSVSAPKKTSGRKYKMVDKRLKNDTRAEKRLSKQRKNRGKRVKLKK